MNNAAMKTHFSAIKGISLLSLPLALSSCVGSLNVSGGLDSLLGRNKKSFNSQVSAMLTMAGAMIAGGQTATAQIGSSGGQLTAGGYTLVIPPGALSQNQQITMKTTSSTTAETEGFTPAGPHFEFLPEGLTFNQPVSLVVPFPSGIDEMNSELTGIYYSNPQTGGLDLVPTTTDKINRTFTASLTHFSTYSPLFINIDAVVNDQITNPTTIRSIASQLRTYLQGITSTTRRNYFYNFYQPRLLPFLIKAKAAYAPAALPLMTSFPNDDFDSDGIRNNVDPFPFDPNNVGDVTPPTVVSATPATTGVSLNPGNVVVTFSEAIASATLPGGVWLSDGNAQYVLTFVSLDATKKIATYSYPYFLNSNQTYTIVVDGVKDLVNNRMVGPFTASTFKTVDLTLPRIVSVTPSGPGTAISTGTMSITFSEPMDPSSMGGMVLKGAANPSLTFTGLSGGGTTANFTIGAPLFDSALYLLQPSATIKDTNGNALAIGAEVYYFQVTDSTPPEAYMMAPGGLTVNPSVPSLQIQFNEPIIGASASGAVTLTSPDGGTIPSISFAGLDTYDVNATYNLSGPLSEGKQYVLTVASGITDITGNANSNTRSFYFRTSDSVAPTLVAATPFNANAVAWISGVILTAQYSEPMSASTLALGLNITNPSGNVVPVTYLGFDTTTNTAFYRIAPSNLSAYSLYTVTPSGSVTDIAGNSLAGLPTPFTFRTNSDTPLLTGPTYLGGLNINICGGSGKINLKASYSREMNPASSTSVYEMTHYYSTDSAVYNVPYPDYTTYPYLQQSTCMHPEPRDNPDLIACLLASFNCGGLYALCAATCYVSFSPQISVDVPDSSCPSIRRDFNSETFTMSTPLTVNSDIYWQTNATMHPSSSGDLYTVVNHPVFNPGTGTFSVPNLNDYDGYSASTPAGYFCSDHPGSWTWPDGKFAYIINPMPGAGLDIPLPLWVGCSNPIPVGNSCP